MTRWAYVAFAVVALTFAANAVVAVTLGPSLPERVPIHWDIHGEPDGWTGRDNWFLLYFLMPTVSAGVVVLARLLARLSPKNFDVNEFRSVYDYGVALVAGLFAALNGVFLASQFGGDGRLHDRWLMAILFLFFAALGQMLGRLRPNFWMGIRTPWTLADPVVWERTHRDGGRWYVAIGLVGAVAAIAGVALMPLLIGFFVGALAPAVYSLVIYKQMQARGEI